MPRLKLEPTQLNHFHHINEVRPIDDADEACLIEVEQVLDRHGALDRFGLILLHGHFPVAEDEILVETCDQKTRTLTSRPIKRASVTQRPEFVQTVWTFGKQPARACQKFCPTDSSGKHLGSSAHV